MTEPNMPVTEDALHAYVDNELPAKRCGWDVHAPQLDATGLKLVGGRLLPGPAGPASFLMYESTSGERFTLYASRATTDSTMRYTSQASDGALYWADRGVGYVLSGPS